MPTNLTCILNVRLNLSLNVARCNRFDQSSGRSDRCMGNVCRLDAIPGGLYVSNRSGPASLPGFSEEIQGKKWQIAKICLEREAKEIVIFMPR